MLVFREGMSAGRRACFRAGLVAVALMLLSSTAHADAGTALIWATGFHLLIGNLFIGIGEGLLIALVFRLKKSRAIGTMIRANYFSACVGAVMVVSFAMLAGIVGGVRLPGLRLATALYYLWAVVAVMFAATLLLEWPYVVALFRGTAGAFRKSVLALLLSQTASYGVIIAWYALVSSLGIYTQTELDPTLHFLKNRDAIIYFVSEADGDVYRMRLDGSERKKMFELNEADDLETLILREGVKDGEYDLYATEANWSGRIAQKKMLMAAVAAVPAYARYGGADGRHLWSKPLPSYWGVPMDWRPELERRWRYNVTPFDGSGLDGWQTDSDERFHIAFNTPILNLTACSATVLPGDEVVFQLEREILVFSTESRRIGVVARGSGPVVLMPEAELPRGLSGEAPGTAAGPRAADNVARQL